ncbi:MAG: Rrf2 family transcriptional regulator [Rhodocyclales bacterium]|nr:Rrf2 family transcriptional regulator [Rhodocyclales bacterium]
MKLNTKSRMAIAAILDVAAHGANRPVALVGVGKRQDISLSYLEQLFRKLRERGIVSGMRGPGGGYRLTKQLSTITVADIIAAVDDEGLDSCTCKEGGSGRGCPSHGLWCRVNHHLHDYLRTVTLDAILEDQFAEPAAEALTIPAATLVRRPGEVHQPGLM